MTTALPVAHPARPSVAVPACFPTLGAVRLGSGDHLLALARAALETAEAPVQAVVGEPAGYVLVVDGWAEGRRPADVAQTLGALGDLDGRPVGLIVAAADICDAIATLAELRGHIAAAGGLPLDGGLCVEPADAACDQSGDLADVTLHSRLVLLGRRVQRLAASRLTLRTTD